MPGRMRILGLNAACRIICTPCILMPSMRIHAQYGHVSSCAFICPSRQRPGQGSGYILLQRRCRVELFSHYFRRCHDVKHQDRHDICKSYSWQRRGWCRPEAWASCLAIIRAPMMVCENAALTPYLLYIDKLLAAPCHTGQFTCCRLRHIVDGQTIACDKTQVSGALEEIVSHDFQRCRDAIYLLQRHTSLYLTTAQIIHGSYFNIAPMDIVERLFDL